MMVHTFCHGNDGIDDRHVTKKLSRTKRLRIRIIIDSTTAISAAVGR